ncbi:MAG: diacylglycerol kinase family protein [Spongiibacteraceae bacterium]
MAYDAQENLPLFIVMNAGSGRGDTQQAIQTVRAKLSAADREFELYIADNPKQLPALAEQAANNARRRNGAIIGAGGDGTLNLVAQQAYAVDRPFGALPQGTFNYFGRNHQIPEGTAAAVDALLQARTHDVQVGEVNGHLFLVNASLGLYPRLLQDREAYKQQFGRSRIVAFAASVKTLLQDHRALLLQIESNESKKMLFTSTLFVGNNALQLQQVGIDEAEAVPDQLTAVAVRPGSKMKMLSLLLRGALGNLGASDQIESFAFTQLTVRPRLPYGRKRIKVAIDGEIFWFDSPLRFALTPRPLQLLKR